MSTTGNGVLWAGLVKLRDETLKGCRRKSWHQMPNENLWEIFCCKVCPVGTEAAAERRFVVDNILNNTQRARYEPAFGV
jgi:hypothetical protein